MKYLKLITWVTIMCISVMSCTNQNTSSKLYNKKSIPKVSVQLWSVKN
ncbi:MAG: hypothetical protein ACI9YH_001262 [Colwellia sp.]|jgi:hypothetical protein